MLFLLFCNLSDEQKALVERIFLQHRNKFYNIAYSYLKSEVYAQDAVSESMIKIMKNITKISALSCPQMYAFCVTIVKNTSLDILRKNKNLHLVDPHELEESNSALGSFEDVFATHDELFFALKHLNHEDLRLIELHYGLELNYREIAQLLHLKEETVKKRSQRILQKIRKQLSKEVLP